MTTKIKSKPKSKKTEEKITFREWDIVEELKTREDVIGYLEAALEENDTALLFSVLGDIARSQGMAQIARDLNLNREALYRSLSPEGNPSFNTVVNVLYNFGFQLSIRDRLSA